MLLASQSLLANQGLSVAANLVTAIDSYRSTQPVALFYQIIDEAADKLDGPIFESLQQVGADSIPALTDSVPQDYDPVLPAYPDWNNTTIYPTGFIVRYSDELWIAISVRPPFVSPTAPNVNQVPGQTYTPPPPTPEDPPGEPYPIWWERYYVVLRMTEVVLNSANAMLTADVSRYLQIYGPSLGYQATANQFINSGNNAGPINETFVDMDALTTGGLSLVNADTNKFGEDLQDLGVAINPGDISNLGFPSTLLRQIFNAGGLLPVLRTALIENGLTDDILAEVAESTQPLTGNIERLIYTAMQTVTGNDLAQVLQLLDVRLTTLSSLASLLDPSRIFVRSRSGLRLLIGQTPQPLYLADGSINQSLETEFDTDDTYLLLKKIIPADQALANRALSRSFFQIKNVLSLSLPEISVAAISVQPNTGLESINNLTQAVSPDTVQAVTESIAGDITVTGNLTVPAGSGPKGSLYLADFVGTPAGYPHTTRLDSTKNTIDEMRERQELDGVIAVFDDMFALLQTAGPYDDEFANVLIPAANQAISSVQSNYAKQADSLNESFDLMAAQLVREPVNQTRAGIDLTNIRANNTPVLMSFAQNLHTIGQDESEFGPLYIISETANQSTPGGQAIIASLREGKNIKNLENAGIGMDTQLPAD
jgi:hypothetical protein